MKTGDLVCWYSYAGERIEGLWTSESGGVSEVNVSGRIVHVATSSLFKVQEEAGIMMAIRDVVVGFAIVFGLLAILTFMWRLCS